MHLLLTGAGFTRNWGGWIADEAFEYLLGCPEITPHITNLLWRHKEAGTGFEGVLQELRDEYVNLRRVEPIPVCAAKELQTFDRLLVGMFDVMNSGFGEFEPGKHQGLGPQPTHVRDFLCRFDAIFTLNQDTLLEQKYASSNIIHGSNGRWKGLLSPGLGVEMFDGKPTQIMRPLPPFKIQDKVQPYYKLHGSSNWRDGASSLLIMGENKGTQIDGVALLDWYRQQFREMLSRQGARLMIIGYGFRDLHINEIIVRGTQKGAKIFIVDPSGVDALRQAPHINADVRGLQQFLQGNIIGASRRPFLSNFTADKVELSKLNRFFS
jgi:SIR2-like domain